MLNNYLFTYYPVLSKIHRQNPTIKIINFILIIIILCFSNTGVTALIIIFVLLVCLFSKVPLKNYLQVNWTFRFAHIFLILIFAFLNLPLSLCLDLIIKFVISFTYLMLLTYTTSSIEIANGVEHIITPFNIFYLKIGKLSLRICMFLKFIPVCLDTTHNILNSQSSRGFDYHYRSSFGKMLILIKSIPQIIRISHLQTNNIRENMELKLYNCNAKRTNLHHNWIQSLDVISTTILIVIIIINYTWFR